jgi:hypothetical protein
MAQRIYWVPHTVCFFGCEHCHNDSVMDGIRADRGVIDGVIANLPEPGSTYALEEILIGGGESLMRNQQMEYLITQLRARLPRGPQATIKARQQAGHVVLGLQTMGFPLADAAGIPIDRNIRYWLDLGIDYFHIASNDVFHERQRPDYPWEALRQNLRDYSEETGVEIWIYGKASTRLVPSGRVLDHLAVLSKEEGATLLTSPGYCASAWEGGANFLSGQSRPYPDCSEVVIDPHGWVHPCCWHELAPGLFDLGKTRFEDGMAFARTVPFCHAIDEGDMLKLSALSGIDASLAQHVRDTVGDCGACRLCSVKLASEPGNAWIKPTALSDKECRFYTAHLGEAVMQQLFAHDPSLRIVGQ